MFNKCFIGLICFCLFMSGPFCMAEDPAGDLPTGTEKITFLEFGSIQCIPCKQMKPIVDEITTEYAGQVKVIFYDVKKDGRAKAKEYAIKLIPTQVFLDAAGKEVYRHQGFLGKNKIEALLKENGIEA